MDPTQPNHALLVKFRLSSDAEILLLSTETSIQVGAKLAKTCMNCVHIPTELPFCAPPLVVGHLELLREDAELPCYKEGKQKDASSKMRSNSELKFSSSPPLFPTFFLSVSVRNPHVSSSLLPLPSRKAKKCPSPREDGASSSLLFLSIAGCQTSKRGWGGGCLHAVAIQSTST